MSRNPAAVLTMCRDPGPDRCSRAQIWHGVVDSPADREGLLAENARCATLLHKMPRVSGQAPTQRLLDRRAITPPSEGAWRRPERGDNKREENLRCGCPFVKIDPAAFSPSGAEVKPRSRKAGRRRRRAAVEKRYHSSERQHTSAGRGKADQRGRAAPAATASISISRAGLTSALTMIVAEPGRASPKCLARAAPAATTSSERTR